MFNKTDIEKYFIAEKSESILFIVVGILAIVISLVFFFYIKSNFFKGAAIPFIIVGIMHLIVGYTIYNRSDADRKRNVYAYDLNPGELKNAEIPRMKTVATNFVYYRYTEIVLLLAGIILFVYFKNTPEKYFWKGLGMALALEALIRLGAEFFAEKRAKIYLDGLTQFTEQIK